MSARLQSALTVGAMGAIGAWLANFSRLSTGSMTALDGLQHSVAVLVIAATLWFLFDMMRNR